MATTRRCVVAATAISVLVATLTGCASRSRAKPAAAGTGLPANTAAASASIELNEDATFHPADQPPADALTAAEAWASYEKQIRGTHPTVPDYVRVEYGTFTLSGTVANRPAWAFILPNSGCVNTNPRAPVPPNGCNEWTVVDAVAGSLIVLTWQEN